MESSIQYMTFDGAMNFRHVTDGIYPAVKSQDGDLTLYFCHYTPIECGISPTSFLVPSGNLAAIVCCVNIMLYAGHV